MSCTGCGRDNDVRRRYCGECGLNLRPCCVRCGFENEARDRYCGGCGDALGAGDAVRAPARTVPSVPPIAASAPRASVAVPARRPLPDEPRVTLTPARPTPAPLAVAAVDDVEVVGEEELSRLLRETEAEEPKVSLLEGRVTQDDLDQLFGGQA